MRLPNIYHEMIWSTKNQDSHTPKECGFSDKYCKLHFATCIENIFPKTSTMLVTYKDESVTDRYETDFRIKGVDNTAILEECQPENIGTQLNSKGDSGTGHWIANTETEPPRAVLVAISTLGSNRIPEKGSLVQKTTDEDILRFIKQTLSFYNEM